jgi:hypothetical protein
MKDVEIKEEDNRSEYNSEVALENKIIRDLPDKYSIPFITKTQKEEKEEIKSVKNNNGARKKSGNIVGEDEIDCLINKIDKSKGRVIIEDKAKLEFDDTEMENKIKVNVNKNLNMDIREVFIKQSNKGIKGINTKMQVFNSQDEDNLKSQIQMSEEVKSEQINFSEKSSLIIEPPKIALNPPKINSNPQYKLPYKSAAKIKIIDPYIINYQEKITNSELILSILELCLNSKEYGFKYKTKSRAFWEDILKKENLKNIFINFKADTLKKYWSILSELKDQSQLIDLIKEYKDLIDHEELK